MLFGCVTAERIITITSTSCHCSTIVWIGSQAEIQYPPQPRKRTDNAHRAKLHTYHPWPRSCRYRRNFTALRSTAYWFSVAAYWQYSTDSVRALKASWLATAVDVATPNGLRRLLTPIEAGSVWPIVPWLPPREGSLQSVAAGHAPMLKPSRGAVSPITQSLAWWPRALATDSTGEAS